MNVRLFEGPAIEGRLREKQTLETAVTTLLQCTVLA
jgi:hypothetical protein